MTKLTPSSVEALSKSLAEAHAAKRQVNAWDLGALSRIRQYTPEDMTVTVETGITLGDLQARLAAHGQWLPVDPPAPETVPLHSLLADNLSGPRRYGYGPVREHLIGLKVVFADGRIVASGGQVVKNVAGYDLAKLFVGDRGSLGVVVEAAFKLRPLPEAELILGAACASFAAAEALLRKILDSPVSPVILDLHRLKMPPPGAPGPSTGDSGPTLVVGFAGTQAEVDWQREHIEDWADFKETNLDYDAAFRANPAQTSPSSLSVLPSNLFNTLETLGPVPMVARAGNGIVYHHGNHRAAASPSTASLMRRLKDTFDPHGILPDLTFCL